MKKTLRNSVIALCILSIFFTLAWAGVFAFDGLDITKSASGGFNFQALLDSWVIPHAKNVYELFTGKQGWWIGADGSLTFILTYVAIAFSAFSVILLVLGCVYNFKYKRKRCLFYGLEIVLATAVVLEFVANYTNINNFRPGDFPQGYLPYFTFSFDAKVTMFDLIFTCAIVGCAGFAYITMAACCFTGFAYAKRLYNAAKAPEALEEEVPAEEVVEEPVVEEPAEEPIVGGEDVDEAFSSIADEAPADEAVEEAPIEEETLADKEDFADEPPAEEEPVEEKKEEVIVQEVPQNNLVTKDDLAAILKDVVRDIVRDEIARSGLAREEERDRGDHSITGATFGGPLIIQYFNGGVPGQEPQPQRYEPQPQVVQQQPQQQQPKVVEAKVEEPKQEVVQAPVQQKQEATDEDDEKNPIIRIPFVERMLGADKEMKQNYNDLKNEILSYGVNSRVSNSGDTFRLHRKTYVKITIAGKSLKLYFALDPADYADSKMPIGDASHHAVYAEIPLIFKVKSGLSLRRAKELIKDVMSKDGLEQGEVGSVNWAKELKAEAK